jgi:hypothetical protein
MAASSAICAHVDCPLETDEAANIYQILVGEEGFTWSARWKSCIGVNFKLAA